MGFDIECIVDISTYPGEYFCPVCRTLVYPSEAFQAQCTHLYCKPCLAHIANGTKACPYDGYLVTESDSKLLTDSDKALAENIGKVKVHCLFFRSGCSWEGTLADCTSHCSACTFGNSPVICNRCGIQIVHRQVHDHAQICSGVPVTTSTATAEVTPSGPPPPPSQAQNPSQTAAAATSVPGQNPNLQVNASSQAAAVGPVAAPTPDQWYQQQYQQYYQQYAGYDPYQQQNQQYYAFQQQPFQQYQQGQTQPQAHIYTQPQAQPNPVPQAAQQPHPQAQAQGQAQSQPQSQMQLPTQVPPSNYQVNPQQQPYPAIRPPQTLPPPPQSQPPPFAQGVRPQVPQYQQPHVQMHHPQSSQAHVQPQMHPQSQPHVQPSNQSYVQPYHAQSQPPVYPPPQVNHSTAPPALPHQSVPPVSGHHSYQQPQPTQKMQTGASQQHLGHPPPAQLHGQVPPQPAVMRPPHSLPQQQPPMFLPPQNPAAGIHSTQNQQFPQAQQSAYPLQHRPVMQPVQQAPPQQYAQQQHFVAPFQNQLQQQGNIPQQQQPMQTQMRPPGLPQPQQSQGYIGRPMMGLAHPQNHPVSSGRFGPQAQPGLTQPASNQNQMSINQNYERSTVLEQNSTVQGSRSPSKGVVEKGSEGDVLKEVDRGQNEAAIKDADNASKEGLVKPVIKQEEDAQAALEQASGGKSFEAGAAKDERCLLDSDSIKQVKQEDLDNQKLNLSNTMVVGSSTEGQVLPLHSHGSHEQRPPLILGQQGPANLPHPGQSLHPTEGRAAGYIGPPNNFESQSDPRGVMGRGPQLRFEGQYGPQQVVRPSEVDQMSGAVHVSGSGEGGSLMKTHGDEPTFPRMNGGTAPDSSMLGSTDEYSKGLSREHLNPFPATRSLDKAPHGPVYDAGANSRFVPHHASGGHSHTDMFGAGPEFGQHHMKHFGHRSPDREYHGSSPRVFGGPSSFPHGTSAFDDINSREAHRFGEGARSFNLSSDPVGNPFRDGRFPPMSGHMRRGDIDGPGNPRFGDDAFGPEGPGHLMRGKFSGPGYLPGHFNTAETAGHGAFPGHGHMGEMGVPGNFARGRPGFPHFGEPAMRNNYSLPGFANSGNFQGGMESFDQSRKRRPLSTGWCRICEVDCDTVEGLDMHSQTREHQKTAIDMVKMIKMQNRKKQRTGAGNKVHEGGSRSRKGGIVARGSKR